ALMGNFGNWGRRIFENIENVTIRQSLGDGIESYLCGKLSEEIFDRGRFMGQEGFKLSLIFTHPLKGVCVLRSREMLAQPLMSFCKQFKRLALINGAERSAGWQQRKNRFPKIIS